MTATQRLVQIDVLRIISMIMVIFLHTILSFTIRPDFFNTKLWWLLEPIAAISKTSVLLFLMLSGYLVISKTKSIPSNLHKTMVRLGIPFVIFTLLNILFDFYVYDLGAQSSNFWEYQLQKLYAFPSTSLWFLVVLIPLYLLNPLWIKVISQQHQVAARLLVALTGVFTVGYYLVGQFMPPHYLLFTNFTAWTGYAFFYLYGGACQRKIFSVPNQWVNLFIFIAGLVLTMAGDYFTGWQATQNNIHVLNNYTAQYASLPVVMMAIGIFNLITELDLSHVKTKVIPWLAQLTFGIYLLHTIVIMVLSSFFSFTFDKLAMNVYLYNLLNVAIVLCTSIFLTQIVKSIPIIKKAIGS